MLLFSKHRVKPEESEFSSDLAVNVKEFFLLFLNN